MQTSSIVIEANSKFLDAPRTILLEAFGNWLALQKEFKALAKDEVVVSVVPKETFGRGGRAIGEQMIWDSWGRPNSIWQVKVAYGAQYDDSYDLASWMVTLPHELLHIADFTRRSNGLKPSEMESIARIPQDEALEDSIEEMGRDLMNRFIKENPEEFHRKDLNLGAVEFRLSLTEKIPKTTKKQIVKTLED
jgi:hypothetical protein